MRVPTRKVGNLPHVPVDHNITEQKYKELERELKKLKEKSHPQTVAEVKRLAEFGDFSENAAYGLAKGRLRWINQRILDLEQKIMRAVIIKKNTHNKKTVQLGSTVTIEIAGQLKKYLILGASETNPGKGIISHLSPIGSALMGSVVGEEINLNIAGKNVSCKVLKIE